MTTVDHDPAKSCPSIDFEDLLSLQKFDLGHSDWVEVSRDDVDKFARLSSDPVTGTSHAADIQAYVAFGLLPLLARKMLEIRGLGSEENISLKSLQFDVAIEFGDLVRLRQTIERTIRDGDGYRVTKTFNFDVMRANAEPTEIFSSEGESFLRRM